MICIRLGLHGNSFQCVVIRRTGLHFLFKLETVVGLVSEVKEVCVILCGINRNHSLLGERNVDVKYANCKTDEKCWPRNVVQNGHFCYDNRYNSFILYFSLGFLS